MLLLGTSLLCVYEDSPKSENVRGGLTNVIGLKGSAPGTETVQGAAGAGKLDKLIQNLSEVDG